MSMKGKTCGLLVTFACMGTVSAHAAASAADDAACKMINVSKLTADPAKLGSPLNQEKLRHDLFVAAPTNFSQPDELAELEAQIALSAEDWQITDSGRLKETLTDAMIQGCESLANGATVDDALSAALAYVRFPRGHSSQYYLYLGSVFSLQAQGGFTTNVDADFLSRTSIVGAHLPPGAPGRDSPTLDGVFELTYAKIGAVASPQSGAPPTPAQNATTSPFTSASGILRGNLSLESTLWNQYVGAAAGVGFTSRTDSTQQTNAHLSPREFIGVLFLANYGTVANPDHATGRVLLGYAHDKFWQPENASDTSTPNQPNRVFLDGRIEMPGVFKSKSVKFSFQVFADAPMSSHGPADVRFNLLISADLQSLLGIS